MEYNVDEKKDGKTSEKMGIFSFLFKPRIISFFILILIPLLVSGYFLTYMFPILGSDWGLSDSHIGYSYILSGMCAIIFGNRMTEYFSVNNRKVVGLFLSAALYACAFLTVASYMSVLSLMVALVLIGFAECFGVPLLSGYFTDLDEVEKYGYDRGIGLYSLIGNGAESLGSFVFGIILISGVAQGLALFAVALLLIATIFAFSTRIKKGKIDEEKQ